MEADAQDFIHIEQLEVFVRVGVTENERANPQRITLSITVWPTERFEELQDDISNAVNYSALCHPLWDPLRDNPRFDTIVVSLAPK